MLYNFGQLRQYACQLAGITDTNGNYDLDTTTFPTLDMGNNMLNDSIREVTSAWDYQFLETSKSYQFYHVVSGVQSVWLSGTSTVSGLSISGTVTPYPNDVLNYSWTGQNTVQDVNSNFSGLSFVGVDASGISHSGVSVSGAVVTANWTGVGFTYQLDPDIDKFLAPAVVIAHTSGAQTANGIICQNYDYEDIVRLIPIGVINASGTPSAIFEAPVLGPVNNKVIQFFPAPLPSYSGQTFNVNYKKKHVDLVSDTDVQTVIPEQFQNVIIQAFLEKIQMIRTPDRVGEINATKEGLIRNLKVWDANQPSKMRKWRDFNFNSNTSSAYDSSVWFTLGDAPR